MKKYLLATALAALTTPALAEPSCTPAESATPVWQAIKAFEEQGGEVMKFKINGGNCYEIYGKIDGRKMEVFFDPATGQELERIES